MSRPLKFGDVIRVDPEAAPMVPQPDDRRWMIVAPRQPARLGMWAVLYLGPDDSISTNATVSHWTNLTGFIEVDDDV